MIMHKCLEVIPDNIFESFENLIPLKTEITSFISATPFTGFEALDVSSLIVLSVENVGGTTVGICFDVIPSTLGVGETLLCPLCCC